MPSAGQAPSHSLAHSFIKYFIMRIFSAKQRSAPASPSRTPVGEGRRAENFQVFRPGVFPHPRLPSSGVTRQRDLPRPLPWPRVPPEAPWAPARLLLHSPARGGAAAPGARPAPAPSPAQLRAAGGTAVVRSPEPPSPLRVGPPRRW